MSRSSTMRSPASPGTRVAIETVPGITDDNTSVTEISLDGAGPHFVLTSGSQVKYAGHLVAANDNAHDLGTSSAQWRNVYAGTAVLTPKVTLSGSGPHFVHATPDVLTVQRDDIAAANTAGLKVQNTTAATSGNQKFSPMFVLGGRQWRTDIGGGTSTEAEFAMQMQPVQAGSLSTELLFYKRATGAGAWTRWLRIDNNGAVYPGPSNQVSLASDGVAFSSASKLLLGSGTNILRSTGSVMIGIDADNNNTDRYFDVRKDATGETGALLFRVREDGRMLFNVPASAITDGDLSAGQISFYIDEAAHELKARVKYSNGSTLKTFTGALA